MNLAGMERLLEKSSWVADAEIYFDSQDVLHITATERQPIARIFTTTGTSFYIDSSGRKLPFVAKNEYPRTSCNKFACQKRR
jgi:cell division protein FtsQ